MNDAKITEGVIWKNILIFSVPVILSSFFQHLYTIADTFIVSRYFGDTALSAVGGSASKIIVLITNFFAGVSVGVTSYTARNFNCSKTLKSILANGCLLFTGAALLLSFVGIRFQTEILTAMSTPAETMAYSSEYLRVYLYGVVFCVWFNLCTGILRALGDSKSPFYVLVFCSLLNIAVSLLFIVVFNFGIAGVAGATVLSQAVSAVLMARIISKHLNKQQDSDSSPKLRLSVVKEIAAVGFPSGLQSIMYSMGNILIQSTVNTMGMAALTGWVLYLRVDTVADIFVTGLTASTITFVGQNYSMGNMSRVKSVVNQSIIVASIASFTVGALMLAFRDGIFSLFTQDAEVIRIAGGVMMSIIPMYVLCVPQWVYTQTMRGLGKTFVPMLISLVGVVGFRTLWVLYILPMNSNIYMLGAVYPVNSIFLSIVFYFYYRYTMAYLPVNSTIIAQKIYNDKI